MSTSGFLDPHAPLPSAGADLASLIERDTPLFWFEAVAIVQELCAVLLASRLPGSGAALEPDDVAITHDGRVEVRSGTGQGLPSVASVAHLLLTLLGEAETVPVKLRLLALQEVSPTPTATTLGQWSAGLADFERPGRQRTIRDVYERFMLRPSQEGGTQDNEPPRIARVRPAMPRWWRSRQLRAAAASVVLLVGAGLAAVWLWHVVAPILAGWGDRQKPESSAATGAETLSAEAVERIRAAAFRIWGGSRTRPAEPAPETLMAAEPLVVVVPTVLPEVPAAEPALVPPAPVASAPARTAGAGTTLFSAADAAVVPPALLRPRLPTRPSAGVREDDLPQVELIVSPKGDVESVKLLTRSSSVKAAMMLSAIKTWRFEPATRDGEPVRYRLNLRLTNQ